MCVDKLIPTAFASIGRHHVGGACCRRQRSRHAETNTKKGIESGMLSFFNTLNFVGVTGLEPATSRPPDAYSNQLSYTPIVFWRITLEKQDFLCVCECKGSTFIRLRQIFRGLFLRKTTSPTENLVSGGRKVGICPLKGCTLQKRNGFRR